MVSKKLQDLPKELPVHEEPAELGPRRTLARWYRKRRKRGEGAELRKELAAEEEVLRETALRLRLREISEKAIMARWLPTGQSGASNDNKSEPPSTDPPALANPSPPSGPPEIYIEAEVLAEMRRLMSKGVTKKARVFEAMQIWTKNKYGKEISDSTFNRRWRKVRPTRSS
jgi:hypothetical protein